MKQLICIVLTCMILFLLSGCDTAEPNGFSFYYCRKPDDYQYFEPQGVIHAEQRDISGHRNDLRYMVSLYLAGPMDEELMSPFANKTMLLGAELTEKSVYIELSGHDEALSDSEFTLACACLTLTCMDFTPCDAVTIVSGSRSVTLNTDSILLYDTLPLQETTGG